LSTQHENIIFAALKKKLIMGNPHDQHHGHQEAQQNEIGGPVTFALICLVAAVVIIYFLAQ
jgi:hypothetical protein